MLSICLQLPAKATWDCCQSGNMTQDRPGLGGLNATPTASVDFSATQSIDINIVIFHHILLIMFFFLSFFFFFLCFIQNSSHISHIAPSSQQHSSCSVLEWLRGYSGLPLIVVWSSAPAVNVLKCPWARNVALMTECEWMNS